MDDELRSSPWISSAEDELRSSPIEASALSWQDVGSWAQIFAYGETSAEI